MEAGIARQCRIYPALFLVQLPFGLQQLSRTLTPMHLPSVVVELKSSHSHHAWVLMALSFPAWVWTVMFCPAQVRTVLPCTTLGQPALIHCVLVFMFQLCMQVWVFGHDSFRSHNCSWFMVAAHLLQVIITLHGTAHHCNGPRIGWRYGYREKYTSIPDDGLILSLHLWSPSHESPLCYDWDHYRGSAFHDDDCPLPYRHHRNLFSCSPSRERGNVWTILPLRTLMVCILMWRKHFLLLLCLKGGSQMPRLATIPSHFLDPGHESSCPYFFW